MVFHSSMLDTLWTELSISLRSIASQSLSLSSCVAGRSKAQRDLLLPRLLSGQIDVEAG